MRHQRRNGQVGLCVGIAALSVLAVVPPGALAGAASTRIKRVFYTATPGEVNNLTLGLSGTDYTLDDLGATITAASPCAAGGTTATCPAAGIIGITVSADDGADSVTNTTATPSTLSGGDGDDSLAGGPGNDTLRGNKGVDTHSGGAGDDYIDARGDAADVVNCGDGADTVIGDTADSIAADCETVDRGVPPPVPPTAPTPAPTPTDPPPAAKALLGPSETRLLGPGACVTEQLGTVQNDLLDGTDLGDSLFGLQGDDILNGLPGEDCLFGGVGSDRLSGSQGDDRLLGDDSSKGIAGNDRLSGDAGSDLLVGGPGRDRLSGGAGDDRLTGGRGQNRLRGGSGNDRLNSANGRIDRLSCGRGRDTARADRIDRVRGCERVRLRRR
jgi:Ca2+-binding RTX toxin-like protein